MRNACRECGGRFIFPGLRFPRFRLYNVPMLISPTHKDFDAYYADLAAYAAQGVTHEQATRFAFGKLLDAFARQEKWTVILEQKLEGSLKRPDATLKDEFLVPRGYWEAKDTQDDLEAEIQNKIQRKYPLKNTIFEDTQRAILYQNGHVVLDANLTRRAELAALLTRFFSHTDEQIEQFHKAVAQFKEDIPTLAGGLKTIIEEARRDNPKFTTAFDEFHALCKNALNPAIRAEAIEEMLVQHLLTERLFRTVLGNSEFAKRNVIAGEIEKVIQALTSRSFSRQEFLNRLDYFYVAIEAEAKTITTYSEKQAFLNTVYERFFQGFSKDQADTHGIVYTPQEIVDFMCESVEHVLHTEFGLSLSDKGVVILDPCTGTGNFLVNILRRLSMKTLEHKFRQELFANEVMLLPYYIASLNIEHAYYERMQKYEPFEGICFTDTLDLAESRQLAMFSEENTERVKREKDAAVTVIIGNPPYNVGQQNENDNNKNRRYGVVDDRIRATYNKDSKASSTAKLYDAYVRFFRWASDRLGKDEGVVCFVTNNSFLDQIAFDGMRKHLLQDFTQIYHLDLHGNVRKNPKLSGTTHNVFGIQVGAGITVAVRNSKNSQHFLKYFRVAEHWTRIEKLAFVKEKADITNIDWKVLQSDRGYNWLNEGIQSDYNEFLPIATKETKAQAGNDAEAIFKTYSLGVSTNRDDELYGFSEAALLKRVSNLVSNYNSEVDRWIQQGSPREIDSFLDYSKVKWSEGLKNQLRRRKRAVVDSSYIRRSAYRPYQQKLLYYDPTVVERPRLFSMIFPNPNAESENIALGLSGLASSKPFHCLSINTICSLDLIEKTQCFPLYTYALDGKLRRDNITDWALTQFQDKYGPEVTKRDIFHYVYALLHHPEYRERYKENLKRELPRIPLVEDRPLAPNSGGTREEGQARQEGQALGPAPTNASPHPAPQNWGGGASPFRAFVETGARLAALHVGYEQADEYDLEWVESKDVPFSWRVTKMRLAQDKTALVVNSSLTLTGIPPEAFDYKLGNRSALEWVIDQYQVTTDKRSGIGSDPNRADEPDYIVRLVGRVITVSLETVKWVAALPRLGMPAV